MRKLICIFASVLVLGQAWANPNVQFNFDDFTISGQTNRILSLYFLPAPQTNGAGIIITRDRVRVNSGTNASVIVSNVFVGTAGGDYRGEFAGTSATTTNFFHFPITNGLINAADWVSAPTNITGGFTAYTTSQSDARYIQSNGGTGSNITLNGSTTIGGTNGIYGLLGSGNMTNAAGSRVAYLSDTTGAGAGGQWITNSAGQLQPSGNPPVIIGTAQGSALFSGQATNTLLTIVSTNSVNGGYQTNLPSTLGPWFQSGGLIFEGDSIIAGHDPLSGGGDGKGWPYWLTNIFPNPYNGMYITNDGVSGSTITNVINRFTNNVLPLLKSPGPTILVLEEGINDINNGQVSNWIFSYSNYVAIAEALGFTVIPCTIGDSSTVNQGQKAFLDSANTFIRSNFRVIFDAQSVIADAMDTNVLWDGLHPTTNYYAKMARKFDVAIRLNDRAGLYPLTPAGRQAVTRAAPSSMYQVIYTNPVVGIGAMASASSGSRVSVFGNEAFQFVGTPISDSIFGDGAGGSLNVGGNGNRCLFGTDCGLYVDGAYNSYYGARGGSIGGGSGQVTGTHNSGFGYQCTPFFTSGSFNSGFGDDCMYGVTTGSYNSALGQNTGHSLTTQSSTILLGSDAGNDSVDGNGHALIVGNNDANGYITNIYIGSPTSASASSYPFTLLASSGSGANVAGASAKFAGGQSTGNANGGDLNLAVSLPAGSGSSLNALTNALNVSGQNGVVTIHYGVSSTSINTSMATTSTGCTNSTGMVQIAYVTAATGAALTDNAGNTEFSSVTISAFTPIRIQNGGKFTGSAITYATGSAAHAW